MVRPSRRRLLAGGAASLGAGAAHAAPKRRVEVFGHRGACALAPEHTEASYLRAVADGADYVEPDLVATRDGALVIRHEPEISETTDVLAYPALAARRTTRTIDGQPVTGVFTCDLTLAELKTLRCKERLPKVRPQNTALDGRYPVLTFAEYLDLMASQSAKTGRLIGLVPELKHSTWHAAIGLPLEDRFLAMLEGHPYARRAPVEIQSFETANLRVLRRRLGRRANLRLMQLTGEAAEVPADLAAKGLNTTFAELTSAAGLREMATYADVVAPSTRAVIPLDPDGRLAAPTPLVADAHAAGLLVHPYTFRPENLFLAADFKDAAGPAARNPKGSVAEMRSYIEAGIDGFFTDDPALGRQAVDGRSA